MTKTKRELAGLIVGALGADVVARNFSDTGLWSWLSLYYFDSVCPAKNGTRKPNADPHYILEPENSRRSYRHLLATPCRILIEVPDHNKLFLDAPVNIHGDIIEQFIGRLYLARIPSVRSLIERLYWNPKTGRPKPGILPTKVAKPGDLRNRLPIRIQQLELVYDIPSLTDDELLAALGAEFRGWLS